MTYTVGKRIADFTKLERGNPIFCLLGDGNEYFELRRFVKLNRSSRSINDETIGVEYKVDTMPMDEEQPHKVLMPYMIFEAVEVD